MRRVRLYRLGLCLALVLGVGSAALGVGERGPAAKEQPFAGKVIPLTDVLKKAGVKLDADAAPHWLALVTSADKVYPLVKDDGSRMFFKDSRLLNRPMRLTGRLVAGDFLQVVQVHSVINGKLHEVDYWCDICSIRAFEPGKCACCGGPMALRELPPVK
jgi:hypothetical protein